MADHWELVDLLKAMLALVAGIILGLERELKDKAAGLKTISVICLGSALFSIVSYKVGAPYAEPTRIASYIVSGIGFIGAGVIFKDGLTVSGLTTAGIIWIAAAIGTAIGFGEFFLAGTFMLCSLLVVFMSPWINKILLPRKQNRVITIVMSKQDAAHRQEIIAGIKDQGIIAEEKRMEDNGARITLTLDAVVKVKKITWLQDYLLNNPLVHSFTI